MTIDLRPAGAAAPRTQQVWAHATTEAMLLLRNGEQLLLALIIPIGVLVAGRWFGAPLGWSFDLVAPSVLALAMWSTCFTALAITTGFERRYNVLERLSATPLGTSGILLGKSVGFSLITSGQVLLLAAIGMAMGWRPAFSLPHLLVALPASVLAMVTFAGLALALAGSLRAEVTLGLANLIHLVGMAAGLLAPLDRYPATLRPLMGVLPTAALGEAVRFGSVLGIPVLAVWCVVGLLLARKVFSWTS